MKVITNLRKDFLNESVKNNSTKRAWLSLEPSIRNHLGNKFIAENILSLGSNLRKVFYGVSKSNDQQSGKGLGGQAWNFLVLWYLNLIFWKTPVLIFKKNKFIPKILSESISFKIYGNDLGTYNNIIAFSVPNEKMFEEKTNMDFRYNLNHHLSNNFYNTEVVNIHTNTSFNDTLKEDMLWSLLYEHLSPNSKKITIGTDEFNPDKLQSFKWSLATLASGDAIKTESNDMHARRGRVLSGEVFWGKDSKSNVAESLENFQKFHFKNIFSSDDGLRDHINKIISEDDSYIENFLNLSW